MNRSIKTMGYLDINKSINLRNLKYELFKVYKFILKKIGINYILYQYYKIFYSNKKFIFNNNKYKYFYHHYNTTWDNERCIEIPIILKYIKEYKYENILEIGNVLSHYIKTRWIILDKYEKDKKVIHEDIINYIPNKKFDLIISVSTLEHVGFDEYPSDPNKILKGIDNILSNCLEKNGKMIVTIPLEYNPYLDKLILNNKLKFSKKYIFKKINNKWVETKTIKMRSDYQGIFSAKYIIVGIITK